MISLYEEIKKQAADVTAELCEKAKLHKGQILVVGTDGAAEALESVKAGELSATVAQNSAEIGATSLRRMIKSVKDGEKIDSNATAETIPVDSYVVTKDSAQ